ncbi:hypothetical protein [Streptacidiphilus anmyonensis]|nr:hypothetical protein [Streptacidiphilus anmyonensis]
MGENLTNVNGDVEAVEETVSEPFTVGDSFEPTVEESILASGLHIQGGW